MNDSFRAQLDDEVKRTARCALKPCRKDTTTGSRTTNRCRSARLAMLVARMPSWVSLIIDRDDLDLGGSNVDQKPLRTSKELVAAMEDGAAQALRSAGEGDRRSPDEAVAAARRRQDGERTAAPHRAARYVLAPRASSRAADRLPAHERRKGAGDLRTVGRRPAVCVKLQDVRDCRIAEGIAPDCSSAILQFRPTRGTHS